MGLFTARRIKKLTKKAELLFKARQSGTVADAAVAKEIKLHMSLADIYEKNRFNKKVPFADLMAIESYRVAASLGEIEAQFQLAKSLFLRGNFYEGISKSMYASGQLNQYMQHTYLEALNYVRAAEGAGHAKAKRLHGVAHIRGYGVEIDKDSGFKLVVASIEQDKAWDKATLIFEELGLNEPEFFSSIMSLRSGNKS